jgi:hypothetical protein
LEFLTVLQPSFIILALPLIEHSVRILKLFENYLNVENTEIYLWYVLWFAVPCRAMPRRAVVSRPVPCRAVVCRAVVCDAVPCRAVVSRAVPCCGLFPVPCRGFISFGFGKVGGTRTARHGQPRHTARHGKPRHGTARHCTARNNERVASMEK